MVDVAATGERSIRLHHAGEALVGDERSGWRPFAGGAWAASQPGGLTIWSRQRGPAADDAAS